MKAEQSAIERVKERGKASRGGGKEKILEAKWRKSGKAKLEDEDDDFSASCSTHTVIRFQNFDDVFTELALKSGNISAGLPVYASLGLGEREKKKVPRERERDVMMTSCLHEKRKIEKLGKLMIRKSFSPSLFGCPVLLLPRRKCYIDIQTLQVRFRRP